MSNVQETFNSMVPPPGITDGLQRAMLLSPSVAVFATDADGILTYTDGVGLTSFGFKPGDGVGQHIAEFLQYTQVEREKVARFLSGQPLATGPGLKEPSVKPLPESSVVTTSVVNEHYVELSLVPSFDQAGTVNGLIGFSTSIVERRQIDVELLPKQELLGDLFDSMPEITHILDRNFRILAANKASRDIFVDTQIIGATCYKMISGQDKHCPFCPVLEMYKTGQPTRSEFYDDLRNKYQQLSCFPLYDQERNIVGAVEMAKEVTEQRLAQLALAKSEALLHDTFASISDGIFVLDRDYTVLRANPAMEVMYGEHMPLVGKKCYVTSRLDCVCPDCPTEKMFECGKPVTMEHYEQPTAAKSGMWLDHTAYPIVDKTTGEITGAISVIRDVTERKEVELELQKYRTVLEELVERRTHELTLSEARLRSILETSSAAISFADWQGNLTYINEAYKKLFGYSEDELYGRSAIAFSEGTDEEHQGFRNLLEGKTSYDRPTMPLRAKDGRLIWTDINASVVRGTDPTETQLISVIVDVTERQRILEELQQAKTAAEDASLAKSQFLATMSHEIRTPLNGVIGLSDLLLTTELQPKQLEYARLIKSSGSTLLFLINDILDFSKIEAGKFELDIAEFDLHDAVESVVGIMASKANDQNLQLAATFGQNVPHPVRGDIGRLRQILINLVGNGLKFTETGGVRIHVSAEELREEEIVVRFEVIDNGIGIPEDRLHRLFQPFSQVDASSARVYGGTGLGLAICKTLVELMGGTIGVHSTVGQGSTFWISVPLGCAPGILECRRLSKPLCVERKAAACQRTGAKYCPGTKHRVDLDLTSLADISTLIVSANEVQLRAVASQFKTWKLEPETTTSGTVAWELLDSACRRAAPFRLMVVDNELADEPGSTLIDRVLRDERMTGLAVIGLMPLSAELNNDFHREKGVQYLAKPVYCSSLFEAMMMALFKDHLASECATSPIESVTGAAPWKKAGQDLPRVLVAEDNRINQIVIGEILANAGLEYKIVTNGLEAGDAVKNEPFDIILMDCQMPLMDGYEATAEIRNWERARQCESLQRLPIIALTANATKGDVEKCLGAGMDAYCSKPIDPQRVIELIGFWTSTKLLSCVGLPETTSQ